MAVLALLLLTGTAAAALMVQPSPGLGAPVAHSAQAFSRCRLALSESSRDTNADDEGEDGSFDLGLLKLPLLTTPERAGHMGFRERQRLQTEKAREAAKGPTMNAVQPAGGNDLGFSLRETVFDGGDDVFGDEA